eukprot:201604_1
MSLIKMLQRRFRYKSFQMLHETSKLRYMRSPRMFSSSIIAENNKNHWWWRPRLPSETVKFNDNDHINDTEFETYIQDQWHRKNKEKLNLCRKASTLNDLFENVSIESCSARDKGTCSKAVCGLLDNVMQRSIIEQCKEQGASNMDSWMVFNYKKHHKKHDWTLCNPEEYDANGVVICGLSTKTNKAYKIGPIVLNKHFSL